MIVYNKLVRDKIPEIIKKNGNECRCHIIIDDKEYLDMLHEKLQEEILEFKTKPSLEEFADVMEVLESIAKFHEFSLEDIKTIKKAKKINRGGFDRRTFLEETD